MLGLIKVPILATPAVSATASATSKLTETLNGAGNRYVHRGAIILDKRKDTRYSLDGVQTIGLNFLKMSRSRKHTRERKLD